MSGAMFEERFIKLVEENGGFEFYQGYAGDVDRVMGGKGDTFWYYVMKKGKVALSYVAKYHGGAWTDEYTKGAATKAAPAGSTMALIVKNAYLAQDEKWVVGRKPRLIEDSHPHYHYVYGFGDKALDVSEKYGVSIAYSDIKDVSVGFHLRYLYTGKDVETP